MSRVDETTELPAIRSAWQYVFKNTDAFEWPFRPEVEVGRIFYPTDGYHLTKQQYSALTGALRAIGQNSFFLSIVESEGLSFLDRTWGHWVCSLPSYDEYSELPLPLENAAYSRHGRWGVMVSHEMHALVGGSRTFLAALDERYAGWAEDLRLLREAWSGNPNAGWLEPTIDRTATA